ncbi:uncharacterized protein LOC131288011 [Anopheles ziemanni]|uniref:uncharacterized protein LOC131259105 n=1 Tax=Anopheles coustani TaxID=139045 RepID=UPI0026595949|nr:uncharacterized protein LOC131259105 [Anopheles coustani]XP_058173090.1 uncharacterized protein LOC131288011 [Anopheles ziemanni]
MADKTKVEDPAKISENHVSNSLASQPEPDRKSDSRNDSNALLQEEIETLRMQMQGWKELWQSAQALIKLKDAEIARLGSAGSTKVLTAAAETSNAVSENPASKDVVANTIANNTEASGSTEPRPNNDRIHHLMNKLRAIHGRHDEMNAVFDYVDLAEQICQAAEDTEGNIDPSYDATLLPQLIKLMPRSARAKFNKLDYNLPKESLAEFGFWINEVAEDATDRMSQFMYEFAPYFA